MRITKFAKSLGLKCPYTIKLKSTENRDSSAKYWALVTDGSILESHLIHVYLGNLKYKGARDLETLIAHELIHAWQEENGFTDIHGESFVNMAGKMAARYNLPNIYIPDLDTP